MFDNFNLAKYKLPPIDLEGTSLTMEDIQNGLYQTKDLDCTMTTYTLEKSGKVSYIVYKTVKWVERPDHFLKGYIDQQDPKKKYLTGNHTIELYDYIRSNDKNDYDITWEALITDGKATSVKLKSFKKISNKQRKQNELEWAEECKKREIYMDTIRYKYFMKYFIRYKRKAVLGVIGILNKIIDLLYKL